MNENVISFIVESALGRICAFMSNENVISICSINRTYVRYIVYLRREGQEGIMFDEVVGSKVAVRVLRALSEQGGVHVSAAARAGGCLRLLAERGIMERREAGRSVLYRPAATEIAKAAQHAVFEERALLRRLESAAAAE